MLTLSIYRNSGLQFDKNAEKRLRRKIDLHIVPLVAILYLFCFIDRTNISSHLFLNHQLVKSNIHHLGNTHLANFKQDLSLQGNNYNLVLSVFYISYALFKIPATLLCKIIGPGWFIPLTTFLFGICTISTAFANIKGQIIAYRILLGIFESSILPGITYYLSR